MLLPLIPLADWFRTILRVLIILLVTIVALYAIVVLYVIVVLLGFVGICCAAIWKVDLNAWAAFLRSVFGAPLLPAAPNPVLLQPAPR